MPKCPPSHHLHGQEPAVITDQKQTTYPGLPGITHASARWVLFDREMAAKQAVRRRPQLSIPRQTALRMLSFLFTICSSMHHSDLHRSPRFCRHRAL